MTLLSNLLPKSLRSLAGAPKSEMYPSHGKFSKSLYSLVRGHVSHDVFGKVIAENLDIHHLWWLIHLHNHLNACELKRSSSNDGLHWCFSTSAFMLDALFAVADFFLHLCDHAVPPEPVLQ